MPDAIFRFIRFLSLALLWIAAGAAAPSLAADGRYQTTMSAFVRGPDIEVGQSSPLEIYYKCFDTKTGEARLDDVTITGLPNGTTANPKSVAALKQPRFVHATLETTLDTTPVAYAGKKLLKLKGRGSCGTYGGISANRALTIRPKVATQNALGEISDDHEIWWFGNLDDRERKGFEEAGWALDLDLYAYPRKFGSYDWRIIDGKEFASFENGKDRMSTTSNRVKLEPTVKKPSQLGKDKGTIRISVTVNKVESHSYSVRIRRPYDVLPPRRSEIDDEDFSASGGCVPDDRRFWYYRSTIPYKVRDQFGDLFGPKVPRYLPVNERFTTDPVNNADFDWQNTPANGGNSSIPGVVRDQICGQYLFHKVGDPSEPEPLPPQKPTLGTNVVHFWKGELNIGSSRVGDGVKVAELSWVRFQDHARHCDIVTPPSSKTKQCPCGGLFERGICK